MHDTARLWQTTRNLYAPGEPDDAPLVIYCLYCRPKRSLWVGQQMTEHEPSLIRIVKPKYIVVIAVPGNCERWEPGNAALTVWTLANDNRIAGMRQIIALPEGG